MKYHLIQLQRNDAIISEIARSYSGYKSINFMSEIKTFFRYHCRGSNNTFIMRRITNDNIQERQRDKLKEVNWQINAPGEMNS